MPLDIQPPPGVPGESHRTGAAGLERDTVVIGWSNNMPDSALEGTEVQFKGLLAAAAGERIVRLRLASMPEVPRGSEARARMANRYWSLEQLWTQAPDAIIVTGTEPKTAVLSDEPYWRRLVQVLEYADANLISSVWSCLAAHAAVLHLDGIARKRLATKHFGVFEQRVLTEHPLTEIIGEQIRIPHSRWNNLPADALAEAGYRILTRSADDDVDLFVKQRRSLLVFFQGHPEYEERTLLKEYQRDVGRFISGEYREYPQVPAGYFKAEALSLVAEFERRLRAGKFVHPLAAFPFAALAASIEAAWMAPATQIYKNWLGLIASRRCAA
jgi:homoserine O-succinyltransferase/O-acetyltransferase